MAATLRRVLGIVGIRDVFVAVAPADVRIALSVALDDASLACARDRDRLANAFARDGNARGVRACFRRGGGGGGAGAPYCERYRRMLVDALFSDNVDAVRAVITCAFGARLIRVDTPRESLARGIDNELWEVIRELYIDVIFPGMGVQTCFYLRTLLNNAPRQPPAPRIHFSLKTTTDLSGRLETRTCMHIGPEPLLHHDTHREKSRALNRARRLDQRALQPWRR
jgi:hypothetical protein